jgi:sulfite reductase (ferredoxin)
MKASYKLWKESLAGRIPEQLAEEIDTFEVEIQLRSQCKVDEKVFAETRLRRGVYGQRYDNGKRHDGTESKQLGYSDQKQTKGPDTFWDAPGMQRIKIPYGGLNPEQLELLAELAEEYSDSIAHITTRQDVQLHYIHIENTPTIMRRLASVGITTREACGNSVRNVTGCPFAGICQDEAFDVTPYAHALTQFLLGHPDAQNFGRKFKPTFSGCAQHSCGLTAMHDLGFTAAIREVNGEKQRGFKMYVGGGLGAVPRQAKLFDEFVTPEEILPLSQAIAKVFGKHGEKKMRSRARIKFLIEKMGMEQFKQKVLEERQNLEHDPCWTDYLEGIDSWQEVPLHPAGEPLPASDDPRFNQWQSENLRQQRQEGYVTATVTLPLGDLAPYQMRGLADIVRQFTRGTVRSTVEQNLVIRWVSNTDVPALYQALGEIGLNEPGASCITDIVACPGTDTCKLGISSSRGLAAELRKRLERKGFELDEAIRNLHIKISGCFNSCGQHHVSDIGFYGANRTVKGFKVPHFQVVLGGQWEENGGSYGLPIVAIPSKRVPDALERITDLYVRTRESGEVFTKFVGRVGKAKIRQILEDLTQELPEPEVEPTFYADWGDSRQYSIGDIGKGECAGEIVTQYEFEMAAAERMIFGAQVSLEDGNPQQAGEEAYATMLRSAKALVQIQYDDVTNDADEIIEEFRDRYFETEIFLDPFAGPKFANYLFAAYDAFSAGSVEYTAESAHHFIEEAQLFVEAVHTCYNRIRSEPGIVSNGTSAR